MATVRRWILLNLLNIPNDPTERILLILLNILNESYSMDPTERFHCISTVDCRLAAFAPYLWQNIFELCQETRSTDWPSVRGDRGLGISRSGRVR